MTVLFLYTELADYFLKCCEELAKTAGVHVIRWPVNREAPFQFEYPKGVQIYDKQKYQGNQLSGLIEKINPGLIICSGWVDREYLKITRKYFGHIPTVLACDTHWKGTIKQRLAVVMSRVTLLRIFSHAWVPGEPQEKYVRRLGFSKEKTKKGFYCCDLKKFNATYEQQIPQKTQSFPKKFLYVGRYYDFKGIRELWRAFITLQEEEKNDWELWCLGTGDIEPVKHDRIRHFGFVQPRDLDPIVKQCGVFVLPSTFEPWGVVVQEYAACGFPLLLSDVIGAREIFLEEGQNGFSFQSGETESLKKALKKITDLNSKELILMAKKSHMLAQLITPEDWVATVKEMYENSQK